MSRSDQARQPPHNKGHHRKALRRPPLLPPLQRRRSRYRSFDRVMSGSRKITQAESRERFLRELGGTDGTVWPIAEAALLLASFDRPRVGLDRYREHLQAVERDVGQHPGAAGGLAERVRSLNEIVL